MFSYLRSHHKRSGSAPNSPDATSPQQPIARERGGFGLPERSPELDGPSSQSPRSDGPPILPPIPRITSQQEWPEESPQEDASTERKVQTAWERGQAEDSIRPDRWRPASPVTEDRPATAVSMTGEEKHSELAPTPSLAAAPTGKRIKGQRLGSQSSVSSAEVIMPSARAPSTRGIAHGSLKGNSDARSDVQGKLSSRERQRRSKTPSTGQASMRAPDSQRRAESTLTSLYFPSAAASTPSTRPSRGSTQAERPASAQFVSTGGYQSHGPASQPPRSKSPQPLHAPSRSGKNKFHLRNPMSLLMRRRFGHSIENLSEDSLVTHKNLAVPAMALPDNYDPRIRGKGVHDFSAPRPTRNTSYNNPSMPTFRRRAHRRDEQGTATSVVGRGASEVSPSRLDREHTPVFTEHFDEEPERNLESAIRAEKLANSDFVARNLFPPPPSRKPPSPPRPSSVSPMAESPPTPRSLESVPSDPAADPALQSSVVLPTVPEVGDTEPPDLNKKSSSKSVLSSRQSQSRATSTELPAHLSSRASRFSFQMASGDSSMQEKLLEERHKERAATKDSSGSGHRDSRLVDMDDYDEGMYDMDMDADDGFEEKIPGVNADADDDFVESGFGLADEAAMTDDFSAFEFSSQTMSHFYTHNPNALSVMNLATPRDPNGHAIGFAVSDAVSPQPSSGPVQPALQSASENIEGTSEVDQQQRSESRRLAHTLAGNLPSATDNENRPSQEDGSGDSSDDLYFDDGIIDTSEQPSGETFDEAAFDDPSNLLFGRQALTGRATVPEDTSKHDSNFSDAVSSIQKHEELPRESPSSILAWNDSVRETHQHIHSEDTRLKIPRLHNLDAYHGALADAANKAAADGRFRRKDSVDSATVPEQSGNEFGPIKPPRFDDDGELPSISSRPSLILDDGRFSQDTVLSQPGGLDSLEGATATETFGNAIDARISNLYGDLDYDDYDGLDDDAMVAAANAEALANDLEGVYGQEFGFYSQGIGSDMVNGGFFGPHGIDRSLSGRNAVREPNLTPITERSEYSTRNSFISLSHGGPQSVPSSAAGGLPVSAQQLVSPQSAAGQLVSPPSLAQIARRSPYGFSLDDDSDISLSQLMRLRRGAFGGSDGSLPSAGSSPRGSPGSGSHAQLYPTHHVTSGSPVAASTPAAPAALAAHSRHDQNAPGKKTGESAQKRLADLHATLAREISQRQMTSAMLDVASTADVGGADARSEWSSQSDQDVHDDDDAFSSPGDRSSSPSAPSSPTIRPGSLDGSAVIGPTHPVAGSAASSMASGPHGPRHGVSNAMLASGFNAFPLPPALAPLSVPLQAPHLIPASLPSPTTPFSPLSLSSPLVATPNDMAMNDIHGDTDAADTFYVPVAAKPGGHSRNSSAADSVTYVREQDERGAGRWVLERRRTGEDGEVEVVDRSIVSGGRI